MIQKLPTNLTFDQYDNDILTDQIFENRIKINELIEATNKIMEWIDQWETYESGWNEYRKGKK